MMSACDRCYLSAAFQCHVVPLSISFCEHTQHHLAHITAGVDSLSASVKTRLEK